MALRWNFRLGPLQFTSPFGVISTALVAGFVLCCCGAGAIGAFTDDSSDSPPPAVPVVETSTPATPDPIEPAEPTEQASTGGRPVTAGAFCGNAGETGVTAKGTAMVCRGPGDLRWRRP